ncbi:hypothetical protein [Alicyclobacillus contaminans]|uniref:hypothetical protein n=1 Tax=Alicyclobacillus contaminans TaxID=392016 RepID=UPI00041E4BA3|nr:hypothetical protein [Alicyclobacillus contaminans]
MDLGHMPSEAFAAFKGVVIGFAFVLLLIVIACYIFVGYLHYRLFHKANVRHAWLAWVPFANLWPLFATVQLNRWHIVWYFAAPAAGVLAFAGNSGALAFLAVLLVIPLVVVSILVLIRLYRAFGISLWWLLLYLGAFIPGVKWLASPAILVLLAYMAFSRSVVYHSDFLQKPPNANPPPGSD